MATLGGAMPPDPAPHDAKTKTPLADRSGTAALIVVFAALMAGLLAMALITLDTAVDRLGTVEVEGSTAPIRQALLTSLSQLQTLLVVLAVFLVATVLLTFAVMGRSAARARALNRTTARLKAVSETSLEAILVSDRSGKVLEFNAAAEEVFGFRAPDIIGRGFADLIIPDHLRNSHDTGLARYNRTGSTSVIDAGRVEVEACRSDGEIFPMELAISRTDTPDGEVFLAFMRDISQRINDERALRKARDEALAGETAKANLLAVMSHEMRTPLNGILGSLELLSLTELTQGQRDHLDIMKKSGDLLLHHVNDVLELSRLDAHRNEAVAEVFDLNQVLQDVADGLHHMARSAGTQIKLDASEPSLTHVKGNPHRLRQVLVNLAGNAVKFTENGTVTLTARRTARRTGGETRAELLVADTGIGIAPEDQARIFDEFVTIDPNYNRKAEGTGLGLAITHRLVGAMGGEIALNSTPGEGTTFTVSLDLPAVPIGRRASDRSEHEDAAEVRRLDNYKVLLVEDNPINRRIARAMLEALGCIVTEAVDGAKGVEAAKDARFDVVLMDISMPEMDGVEATIRIRKGPAASQDSLIVALTAHAMQEDIERFVEAGMQDVVVKPISTERLAKALDRRRNAWADASDTDDTSHWDSATFGEFLEVLGPADTREMLDKFLADAGDIVPWLVWQSNEELDHAEVARRAHGLSGSAAVLGASALHKALKGLETAARNSELLSEKGEEVARVWTMTEASCPDIADDAASVA